VRAEPAFSTLSFWERLAFRVMRFLNQGGGSGPAWIWQRGVITPLVGVLVNRRIQVHGLERLDGVSAGRSHPPGGESPHLLRPVHPRLVPHPPSPADPAGELPGALELLLRTPTGPVPQRGLHRGSMFPPFFRSAEKKG